jgi:hypothetical protein
MSGIDCTCTPAVVLPCEEACIAAAAVAAAVPVAVVLAVAAEQG